MIGVELVDCVKRQEIENGNNGKEICNGNGGVPECKSDCLHGRKSRTPMSAPHFVDIWEHCKDMGLLLGRGGLNANVRKYVIPIYSIYSKINQE